MNMIKNRLVLFVLLFVAWLLLSWAVDVEHLLAGVVIAGILSLVAGGFFSFTPDKFLAPRRYAYVAWLLPVLAWDMLKANALIAFKLAHPVLPERPGIVTARTSLKGNVALTFLATTLTLVSDVMAVDVTPETGTVHLHCLTVPDAGDDRIPALVKKYEMFMRNIFE